MELLKKSILLTSILLSMFFLFSCEEDAEPSGPTQGLVLAARLYNTSVDTESLPAPDADDFPFHEKINTINSLQEAVTALGEDFINANPEYVNVDFNSQSLLVWTITVPECYSHVQLNYVQTYMDSPDTYLMDASFMRFGNTPASDKLMTARIAAVTQTKIKNGSKILTKYHLYDK